MFYSSVITPLIIVAVLFFKHHYTVTSWSSVKSVKIQLIQSENKIKQQKKFLVQLNNVL